MGFTTFYQQRQMQVAQGANNPQAQQMQMLTRIMPVFLIVIGWSFPAALVLYWTVSNLWAIGQQAVTNRLIGPAQQRAVRPPAERRVKSAGAGKSPAAKERK